MTKEDIFAGVICGGILAAYVAVAISAIKNGEPIPTFHQDPISSLPKVEPKVEKVVPNIIYGTLFETPEITKRELAKTIVEMVKDGYYQRQAIDIMNRIQPGDYGTAIELLKSQNWDFEKIRLLKTLL